MFKEILRIRTILDESSAKQLESSLSSRFTRVVQRFGSGLRNVIRGSVLGISVALLQKVLSPIETLDDKMKSLLGQGTDITDLAERLGTSPGQLKQLQDVAQSLKVTPDQFREVLGKFAESVEKAREENANPFKEKSASTLILGDIAQQKDIAEGFRLFLEKLRTTSAGTGIDQALTTKAIQKLNEAASRGESLSERDRESLIQSGQLRVLSGEEARAEFEKQVLGSRQFGGLRKLTDIGVGAQAQNINEPTVQQLTDQINKLSELDSQKAMLEVQAQTKDFINASKIANEQMVQAMVQSAARQEEEKTARLESYQSLKRGADAVADIQQGFGKLLDNVTFALGELKKITEFIPKATSSPMFKGIFNFIGKRE